MTEHQVRRDPLGGGWVIQAPVRSARPHATQTEPNHCPFCPGNEHLVPGMLDEMPPSRRVAIGAISPWAVPTR